MKSKRIVAIVVLIAISIFCVCPAYSQVQSEPIVIETNEEVTQVPVLIINTEQNNTAVAETPIISRVTRCRVHLHQTPTTEDHENMLTFDRGVKLEGSLNSNTGWFKTNVGGQDYYIYSDFLVTESEWEELSKIPYSTEVPLSEDLQKYLWNECQDTGVDYCFALAIIDRETGGSFNPNSISKTSDYGLFQCNICWKPTFKKLGLIQNDMTDLLNPYNSIHAGLYLLSQYFAEYGISEATAFKYNRGHASANSSNDYSRDVVYNLYPKWKAIIDKTN